MSRRAISGDTGDADKCYYEFAINNKNLTICEKAGNYKITCIEELNSFFDSVEHWEMESELESLNFNVTAIERGKNQSIMGLWNYVIVGINDEKVVQEGNMPSELVMKWQKYMRLAKNITLILK